MILSREARKRNEGGELVRLQREHTRRRGKATGKDKKDKERKQQKMLEEERKIKNIKTDLFEYPSSVKHVLQLLLTLIKLRLNLDFLCRKQVSTSWREVFSDRVTEDTI